MPITKKLLILSFMIPLASCTTKFQDTGTSTSVKQMLSNEWNIKSYDLSKPILINNEYEMRISTYSSPFFIHQQWVEQLASPYKKLQGLCRRQNGNFNYIGDNNSVMMHARSISSKETLPPPDRLTAEVLTQIRNSKWIGDYACSSSKEYWKASIKATSWSAKNQGTNAFRYITITTEIEMMN
jgi:hypothetical protein